MMTPHESAQRDADDVERYSCPRCKAGPGSPCRSRDGAVAVAYHVGRFIKVARLAQAPRVRTPADRGPGQRWRPYTPAPQAVSPDASATSIRVGYAHCSPLTEELQAQLDALAGHGIPSHRIFSERTSTRTRARPELEAALASALELKATAPHCQVILTVCEMKRLGRDASDLTALADRLTTHGLALEMLAGPAPGTYDPSGSGLALFAFFAAIAETEREAFRQSILEGLDTAVHKGRTLGRPSGITDEMLQTVLRRRADGESVRDIQSDLVIPTGPRRGQRPSIPAIYRALAEHKKRQAYPEAFAQAGADPQGKP